MPWGGRPGSRRNGLWPGQGAGSWGWLLHPREPFHKGPRAQVPGSTCPQGCCSQAGVQSIHWARRGEQTGPRPPIVAGSSQTEKPLSQALWGASLWLGETLGRFHLYKHK